MANHSPVCRFRRVHIFNPGKYHIKLYIYFFALTYDAIAVVAKHIISVAIIGPQSKTTTWSKPLKFGNISNLDHQFIGHCHPNCQKKQHFLWPPTHEFGGTWPGSAPGDDSVWWINAALLPEGLSGEEVGKLPQRSNIELGGFLKWVFHLYMEVSWNGGGYPNMDGLQWKIPLKWMI